MSVCYPTDPRRWSNSEKGVAAENVLLDQRCDNCEKSQKCPFVENEWLSCGEWEERSQFAEWTLNTAEVEYRGAKMKIPLNVGVANQNGRTYSAAALRKLTNTKPQYKARKR